MIACVRYESIQSETTNSLRHHPDEGKIAESVNKAQCTGGKWCDVF